MIVVVVVVVVLVQVIVQVALVQTISPILTKPVKLLVLPDIISQHLVQDLAQIHAHNVMQTVQHVLIVQHVLNVLHHSL